MNRATMNLKAERDAILADARTIIDGAKTAGRELTSEETRTLSVKVGEVKALNQRITDQEAGAAAMAAFGARGDTGIPGQAGYLDIGPAGIKRLSQRFADKMTGTTQSGSKALLPAGEAAITIPVLPADPVLQAHNPVSLLSILPVITIPAGAAATYVRQSTRTNNAAAVAAGGVKPTSVLGLTAVPVQLHVYAHLSEPVDRFLVETDAPILASFLANELLYGVTRAVEADVINGDPAGANPAVITGLLKTSGIVSVSFGTDLLTSLRAAKTSAENLGYSDSLVYCLSASDWAAAEQARASTGGTYDMSTSPTDAAPRRVWGLPVTVVSGLPAKTAILLDRSAVALYADQQGIRTDWGSPADTWTKNQVVARTEGRFDLAVFQPNAVIKVGTAA